MDPSGLAGRAPFTMLEAAVSRARRQFCTVGSGSVVNHVSGKWCIPSIMNKPYSASCDNNREPIFSVLDTLLNHCRSVLEIGSGTGQHAVYFAAKLPQLVWQCSDLEENHAGIRQWLDEAALPNTPAPLLLDVTLHDMSALNFDAVYSANTIHIMCRDAVRSMVHGVGKVLPKGGLLILYGPFNYGNRYTSDSNARFDEWLKQRDPMSGIRNFEDVDKLANDAQLRLHQDVAMPANNRIISWRKY
jgi:SAM-dependent methyltransferase